VGVGVGVGVGFAVYVKDDEYVQVPSFWDLIVTVADPVEDADPVMNTMLEALDDITRLAAVLPNVTDVMSPFPADNKFPEMVTRVPPDTGPELGVRLLR